MSKKNSKEKRKQQAAKAIATQEQEKNLVKKNPDYVKPEKKKDSKKNEPEELQIKMNFYSAMAMIATLVSAGAFAVAMIISGNPNFYVMKSKYGDSDVANVLVDKMDEMELGGHFGLFCTIAMVLLLVVAVCALAGTLTAMNPNKKPNFVMSIIMVLLSVGSFVLYFVAKNELKATFEQFKYVTGEKIFGLYDTYFVLLIANIALLVINVLGNMYGGKKYKKTGHTC